MRVALLAFGLVVSGPVFPGAPDRAQAQALRGKQTHREFRLGMFGLSRIATASVVMLGDSLTEGVPWSEITGCPYLANRGIGADTSAGVLKRVDEVLGLKPSAVFVMIGINDLTSAVPTDRIAGNVERTIARITRSGAQVYLSPVLPVAESFKQKLGPQVEALNEAYRKIAARPGVTIVDFAAGMREGGYLREDLSTDGIHLRPEGYRIWRDAISPLVDKHCAPGPTAEARPSRSPEGAPGPRR